jgi:hypothetical protein
MDSESSQNVAEQSVPEKKEVKLTEVQVTNEVVALNLLVSFLNVAQRRGAFTMDESAKIWECVTKFQKKE